MATITTPAAGVSPYQAAAAAPTVLRAAADGTTVLANASAADTVTALAADNANTLVVVSGQAALNSLINTSQPGVFDGANVTINLEEQNFNTTNQVTSTINSPSGNTGEIQYNSGANSFASDPYFTYANSNVVTPGIRTNGYFYGNGAPFIGGGNAAIGNFVFSGDIMTISDANQVMSITGNGTGNVQISSNSNVWVFNNAGNLTLPSNTSSINYANGSPYGGGNYSNSNVSGFLAAFGSNVVSTTGNISAGYFVGNGSQLTGLASSYGNANVVANLAALGSNPVSTTGNVTGGNLLFGTGIVSGTGNITAATVNANVYTAPGNISITANIHTWIFEADGNLTFPTGMHIDDNGANTRISQNEGYLKITAGNTASLQTGWAEFEGAGTGPEAIIVYNGNAVGYLGNIVVKTGNQSTTTYAWFFDNQGDLTAPGDIYANNLVVNSIRSDDSSFVTIEDGVNVNGEISATGNISAGNVNLSATGQFFIGTAGLNSVNIQPDTITVTSGTGTGQVFADYFIGDGSNLSGITGGNVTGDVANATYATSAGTVTTNAQPNITSVGILTSLSSSGNITAGNLDATNLVINCITSDVSTFVTIEDGVNVNGEISATGNITGNYFIGNGSQLTSVAVPSQTILPTIQSITAVARPAGLFGGGQGGANVTVANNIPVTEYGVIITAGTTSETYKTGALGSIPGTVALTFTTGLNSTQYTLFAYVTSNAGTYYSDAVTGTSGICLLAGTQIALSDGTHKAIEHITYTDKLLSWNFDRGCYAETTAMWIKRSETGSQYNLLTFSDGTTLRTFDQHRIFNKQAGAFTYPMTDATPVGTITVNEHGQEITLTNKQVIKDTIEYYNVITDYHMNLFSDGVLTSCRFNNIYPITDMKFVKDSRTLRTRVEFENVEDRFFHGLRLAEQTADIETVEWYVNRLLSTEVSTQAELAF